MLDCLMKLECAWQAAAINSFLEFQAPCVKLEIVIALTMLLHANFYFLITVVSLDPYRAPIYHG